MLSRVELKNFGPLKDLKWNGLGSINLILGGNGAGKTFLLKSLYCVMRTLEEYKRGKEQRRAAEILADKLFWTFQPDKIGDLVSKGADSALSCSVSMRDKGVENELFYNFGKDTTRQIALENHIPNRSSNSVFLPAKEILSIHNIILTSRGVEKVFGFDDTYFDLARALTPPPKGGTNYSAFAKSRTQLKAILGGKVELDEPSGSWTFKKGNQKFPIGVTAEGIKKIAILDTLLGNRFLSTDSVIFIDEPESALHPEAISKFLDIIFLLSESGIQIFLASHSYFVVLKLYLVAQQKKISIPVISSQDDAWICSDLIDGIPDNPVIDESIRLYKEEVGLVLS